MKFHCTKCSLFSRNPVDPPKSISNKPTIIILNIVSTVVTQDNEVILLSAGKFHWKIVSFGSYVIFTIHWEFEKREYVNTAKFHSVTALLKLAITSAVYIENGDRPEYRIGRNFRRHSTPRKTALWIYHENLFIIFMSHLLLSLGGVVLARKQAP